MYRFVYKEYMVLWLAHLIRFRIVMGAEESTFPPVDEIQDNHQLVKRQTTPSLAKIPAMIGFKSGKSLYMTSCRELFSRVVQSQCYAFALWILASDSLDSCIISRHILGWLGRLGEACNLVDSAYQYP